MPMCEARPLEVDCLECPLLGTTGCPTYRHDMIGEGKMKQPPDESCDDLDDFDEEEQLEEDDGPGDPPDDLDDFDEDFDDDDFDEDFDDDDFDEDE